MNSTQKPKRKTRLTAWILLILLCGAVGILSVPVIEDVWIKLNWYTQGYTQAKKDVIKLEVVEWLNTKIKNSQYHCLSVKLLKENRNHFVGLAELSDGETISVKVLVDGEEFLMSAQIPIKYTMTPLESLLVH
jgi:hypothetical protein